MKLKSKLKMLVAAVAVACAGQASAAAVLPGNAGGDLWLSVWDSTGAATSPSYFVDLGVSISTFLSAAYQTAGTTETLYNATTTYNGSVGAALPANLLFNVFTGITGSAVTANKVIATTNAPGTSVTNSGVATTLSNASGVYGPNQVVTTFTGVGGLTQQEASTTGTGTDAAGGANWGTKMNSLGSVDTTAGLNTNLNVYQFTKAGSGAGSLKATVSQIGDGTGDFGFFKLDSTGALTYSVPGTVSAVPVPAAAWLFGSGVMGLVGVARRRKNKTQA